MKFSELNKHDCFEFPYWPGLWFIKINDLNYILDETLGHDGIHRPIIIDMDVIKIGDELPTEELNVQESG